MAKGSFLCKPGFDSALPSNLAKKYCSRFVVFNKFCDPKDGCKKRHIPFYSFQPEEKKQQYEHMLTNKDKIRINANDAPKYVPEAYASLVTTPGQGGD